MADGAYVVDSSTTRGVQPRDRASYWSARVRSCQCQLAVRFQRSGDFHGEAVRQRSDTYQLVRYRSREVSYARTAGQVRRDPDEDYRFVLPLCGDLTVHQDGRSAAVSPGTGSLVTMSAPFELAQLTDARAFVMTVPARDVAGRLSPASPVATMLDLTTGLGRVLVGMISGMFQERDHLSAAQFDALCERAVDLMCMLVVGDDRPDAPGYLTEVEALVRRHVREHAADPDLTCASLAQSLGWSLRQVQLALQRVGTTPSELIREERLRLVRSRLQSPAYRHVSITELAHASGFSSASALSTAFRRRFGMTPRQVRSEGDT